MDYANMFLFNIAALNYPQMSPHEKHTNEKKHANAHQHRAKVLHAFQHEPEPANRRMMRYC